MTVSVAETPGVEYIDRYIQGLPFQFAGFFYVPDPLAQPRREISLEERRESAGRCFQKGQWEAAAGQFEKLLEAGECAALYLRLSQLRWNMSCAGNP